jgi:hypothetical protein
VFITTNNALSAAKIKVLAKVAYFTVKNFQIFSIFFLLFSHGQNTIKALENEFWRRG